MYKFKKCFNDNKYIMMEGALSERLKREYNISFDSSVVMGSLVYDNKAKYAIKKIWKQYYNIASKYNIPFMATTPTRRVNFDRINNSYYNENIIKDNINFIKEVKQSFGENMYIGYMLGCRGDAYTGIGCCSEKEAYDFHNWEIELAIKENPDFMYAALIPTLDEAYGIARALSKYDIPYIISFTINENGCLIDGTPIASAIEYIDNINKKPICYMTNCVHPKIIYSALKKNNKQIIKKRFLGVQVNTANLPYSILDNAKTLYLSTPESLASDVKYLIKEFPMKIVGGCCGTNDDYMDMIMKKLNV